MPSLYLTVAEYKERFGLQEAIRLTSETQPPAVDDVKIETAILDAEEEAEGYVSRRYTLPLAVVPKILKTWVADLARQRLHKTFSTPEVKENADRARAQLKEVSTGVFKLTVDDGTQPEQVGGSPRAMTSGDAREEQFTESAMDDYQNLSPGYSPNWMQ